MKRKNFLALAIVALTVTGCGNSNNTQYVDRVVDVFSRDVVEKIPGQKKEWNSVSDFICYYGDFNIDVQSQYDVVIMHSTTLFSNPEAKQLVKQLQDNGTYVIAYITIGEDDQLTVADGLGEGGYASYYVYENGAPKQNASWGSYFVDAGNPVWQAKVLNKADKILSYGVDGLFLDTLDTVDIAYDTIGGMADLVSKLDENFPNAKLIANRGFTVLPYISSHIDGLMFESFNTTYSFTDGMVVDLSEAANEYNENIACNTINKVRQYDYFPVFALDYINDNEKNYMPQTYFNRSWQYDFIPYCTPDINLATAFVAKDKDGNRITPTSTRGELALSKTDQGGSSNTNADVTEANLAYTKNGVTVTVDSTYTGYNKAVLNDGWYVTDENHNQNRWSKESWASLDNKNQDHYVQFAFDEAHDVNKVVVHWANDNGRYYSPQEATVQAYINDEWVDVKTITNAPENENDNYRANETTWTFEFDTVNTTKIRVLQPKGKGAADAMGVLIREGIMWVSEIEIF